MRDVADCVHSDELQPKLSLAQVSGRAMFALSYAYLSDGPHVPLGPASSSAAAASLRAALHAFLWPDQPATWCSRQQ